MHVMMVMILSTLPLRLLSKFTTRLVSPQIIQPRKPPLTPQSMELTQRMLMLGSVRRHVSFEIAAFAVEVHLADGTVHLVATVVSRHVLVADVLVREGFGTVGECAFEGAFGGVGMVFVVVGRCG